MIMEQSLWLPVCFPSKTNGTFSYRKRTVFFEEQIPFLFPNEKVGKYENERAASSVIHLMKNNFTAKTYCIYPAIGRVFFSF